MLVLLVATALAAERLDAGVPGHVFHPVWSPDGRQLVVEVHQGAEDAALRVVGVDGSVAAVVLPGATNPFGGAPPVAMNPIWHGERLIFEATDVSGRFRVFSASADGRAAALDVALPGHLTFPSVDDAGDVAFVASGDASADVYLRRADGSLHQLTRSPVPEMFPAIAPDGGSLVYSRKVGATEDLFLLDLGSSDERPLAGGAGDQTRPVRVVGGFAYFEGGRGRGVWDLVHVNADGARRVLARDVQLPLRARPATSPDGACLAYVPASVSGADRLVVVRADGSARVEIPTAQVAVGEVALGARDDRIWLAWTGLPSSGSDWRGLWAEDVTDRVRAACSSYR